jgi:N-acetylmuramoyl-L-alanine amidase
MSGLPIIAIDPGHNCSPDIGASYQSYSEDKIALGVAQQLKLICDAAGIKTIDCLPKSASSVLDSLQQRCAKSNDGGATIYVSIHCNVATPTSGARGCETYAISTAGKAIAANINREYTKLGFKDRGVKTALDSGVPPYVIRNTNAIAVLTEICFLDATEDTAILDLKGSKAIAQAIFNGLTHGTSFDPQPDNHANDPVPTPSLLVNAAKYYKGLPHQSDALRSLESVLTPDQLSDFKAKYSPALSKNTETVTNSTQAPKGLTVAQWISGGDGSTAGVKGLSDQIIKEMGQTNLVKMSHPRFIASETCDPYFHPSFANRIISALNASPRLSMRCNSAYRSPVRQFVLREFYERGINGITAAALVGTGNHERGLAIDLENADEWRSILVDAGWHWQGQGDPMHFDVRLDSEIPQQAIAAYQRLANRYGANLSVDGNWGNLTKLSMLRSPANGW